MIASEYYSIKNSQNEEYLGLITSYLYMEFGINDQSPKYLEWRVILVNKKLNGSIYYLLLDCFHYREQLFQISKLEYLQINIVVSIIIRKFDIDQLITSTCRVLIPQFLLFIHFLQNKAGASSIDMKYIIDSSEAPEGKTKKLLQEYKIPDSYLNTHDYMFDFPFLKIFCDGCQKDISNLTRVLVEKQDFCLYCFANFTEFPEFYHVIGNLRTLMTKKWTAKKQLLFISLLSKLGFGNWHQIKDQLAYYGFQTSIQQIVLHFNNHYLFRAQNDNQQIFPNFFDNQALIQIAPAKQSQLKQSKNQKNYTQIRKRQNDDIKLKQKSEAEISQFSIFSKHKISFNQNKDNLIKGYNKKRDQFDIQYNSQAETHLANLQFRDSDTEQQMDLKFKIIQKYNRDLDERQKRKRFILQHKLLDLDYQNNQQTSKNKYETEAANLLRPFMRFSSFQEHNQLINRVAFAHKLRSIVQGLRKCRRIDKNGTLQSVSNYIKRKRSEKNLGSKGRPRKIVHCQFTQHKRQNRNIDKILKEHLNTKQITLFDINSRLKQLKQPGQSYKFESGIQITLVRRKVDQCEGDSQGQVAKMDEKQQQQLRNLGSIDSQ